MNNLFNSKRVVLNVGGNKFDIKWKNLEKLPNSRLGKIRFAKSLEEVEALCDEIDIEKNEIYFDRPSNSFNPIVDYYRTGKLHLSENVCILSFYEELTYWLIDDRFFEQCCNYKYHQTKEDVLSEIEKVSHILDEVEVNEKFSKCCPDIRRKVWDTMENPNTSSLAKAITFISIFFVILSTTTFVLSTIPELKVKRGNESVSNPLEPGIAHVELENTVDHPAFEIIEAVCIAWFTLEYLIRLWASPNKKQFLLGPLNVIDLVSILPFYISLIFENSSQSASMISETKRIRRLLTLFRILRVLRIFKLARHSHGLKAFGYTMRHSYRELGLLIFFLSLAVLLFSSLVFFAEKEEAGTLFKSIPSTFWWALITITTVGYGDMVPATLPGRFVSSFCAIIGILVIAMPIPIIATNFTDFYSNQRKKEKLLQYKNERDTSLEQKNNYNELIVTEPLLNNNPIE